MLTEKPSGKPSYLSGGSGGDDGQRNDDGNVESSFGGGDGGDVLGPCDGQDQQKQRHS